MEQLIASVAGIRYRGAAAPAHRMLTPGMATAHEAWLGRAGSLPGAEVVAGAGDPTPFAVRAPVESLEGEVLEEHFGPAVVVCCVSVAAYPRIVEKLEGSLTATLTAAETDRYAVAGLLPALAERAGRIVYNGAPTGVAVCDAMRHGGPWPATSATWSTSVGAAAIQRFVRPVALQGVPADLATLVNG